MQQLWVWIGVALLVLAGALAVVAWQGDPPGSRFVTVVLGAAGGLEEDNLTAYLLAPKGSGAFVSLDAGTLLSGLEVAAARGGLRDFKLPPDVGLTLPGWVLRQIKAYLITHPHLDHVAGLVINSPDDGAKPILGTAATLDALRDHVFNWTVWPNFGNEGTGFTLNKYTYTRLEPGVETAIPGTEMTVEAYVLSHSAPYASTAFLVRSGEVYALFFGDTGPDAVEGGAYMARVWERVAPLVRDGTLRGVFLEASYPDGRPDNLLFGHLTPSWLMAELRVLAKLVDPMAPERTLRGLTVIVTAIKPSYEVGPAPRERIKKQLAELNDLGVRFVVPEQGQRITF